MVRAEASKIGQMQRRERQGEEKQEHDAKTKEMARERQVKRGIIGTSNGDMGRDNDNARPEKREGNVSRARTAAFNVNCESP